MSGNEIGEVFEVRNHGGELLGWAVMREAAADLAGDICPDFDGATRVEDSGVVIGEAEYRPSRHTDDLQHTPAPSGATAEGDEMSGTTAAAARVVRAMADVVVIRTAEGDRRVGWELLRQAAGQEDRELAAEYGRLLAEAESIRATAITAVVRLERRGGPSEDVDADIEGRSVPAGGWVASYAVYDSQREFATGIGASREHGNLIDEYRAESYDPAYQTREGAARYAAVCISRRFPAAKVVVAG